MVNKPHEICHAHVAALHPSMRYNESEDLKKWQKKARKKLNELLGLPFERCDAAFKLEFSKRHKEFTEYRFIIQTEQGYFLPCHVWKPKIRGKLPVMICLQGHAKGMHISMGRAVYPGDENVYKNGDRDFAVQCIRQGICALMIEQRNFGECGGNERGPQCYESSMTALLAGRTTLGERVWDISRAIDALL
ncbi:MAG TPA: hypothetical protein DCY75_08110 [Clostridiales bacterium]|nr:hypothetical protein [Clostridiales bacterium]